MQGWIRRPLRIGGAPWRMQSQCCWRVAPKWGRPFGVGAPKNGSIYSAAIRGEFSPERAQLGRRRGPPLSRRARLSARFLHRVPPARQLPTTHSAAYESLVATGSAVRSAGFVKCLPSGAIGSDTATTHCCRWRPASCSCSTAAHTWKISAPNFFDRVRHDGLLGGARLNTVYGAARAVNALGFCDPPPASTGRGTARATGGAQVWQQWPGRWNATSTLTPKARGNAGVPPVQGGPLARSRASRCRRSGCLDAADVCGLGRRGRPDERRGLRAPHHRTRRARG